MRRTSRRREDGSLVTESLCQHREMFMESPLSMRVSPLLVFRRPCIGAQSQSRLDREG
jgi:hypothetical protein